MYIPGFSDISWRLMQAVKVEICAGQRICIIRSAHPFIVVVCCGCVPPKGFGCLINERHCGLWVCRVDACEVIVFEVVCNMVMIRSSIGIVEMRIVQFNFCGDRQELACWCVRRAAYRSWRWSGCVVGEDVI